MRSKKVGIRICTVQKLVDAGFYEFATGFFEDPQVKVFACENWRRLIQATALMARGVAEGRGKCLVVLPTLESEATIYLQGIFKNLDLSHADWEYKTKQTPPSETEVVFTNQKTLRKGLLKKGQLRLPFDAILFVGLDATLLGADWADTNLVLIRLWEMRELYRISCYFLVERYVTDLVGWLEGLNQEVVTRIDEVDPVQLEATRIEPKTLEQFFRKEFRVGKYNFVLRLTRKWRSKKTLLKAIYRSFPYYLATEGRRTWLEHETLRLLELGRNLHLVYQRKYRYRSQRTAPKAGRVTQVFVKEGEYVERGQPVLMLKTVNREIRLNASIAGQVTRVPVPEGIRVPARARLIEIKGWGGSGLYHSTSESAYLATLDVDFTIMEALGAWLVDEKVRHGPDWRPSPEEFEQKLRELTIPRNAPSKATVQLPKIYRYRPIIPALGTARRRLRRRRMETVDRIVRVEGEIDEDHGTQIIKTMNQVFLGEKGEKERLPPQKPTTPEGPAPEPTPHSKTPELPHQPETPKLKTPIDLAGYVAARLAGRLPRLGATRLSKDELARQSRVHYSTFVKELAAAEIPAHRAYYAVTKYFGETHAEVALTEQDKRRVAFDYRDELVTMASRVTWVNQRDGRGRPRRMLVYQGAYASQVGDTSFFEGAKCKACIFYIMQERACQLWFAAAREGVIRRTTAPRAIRGRVFPELSACPRFRGKEAVTIPAGLVRVQEIPKSGELVEVPVCHRCDMELPKWPSVVQTVECPRCGTAHRKTHRGGLKVIPNAADALEQELQLLCGYTPSRQSSEPRPLAVYISTNDRWHLTPEQLQVEYPGGMEVYSLTEVGHVTCHEERLARQLQEQGIRVTIKTPIPSIQLPLNPELAQAMQQERKERKLLPLFVLGLVFSVRFHTERVREAIKKVHALGGEWEAVAIQFERELEEILAYQEFEVLRCLWGGPVTPGYLRGLEGRVHREVEALLRNLLMHVLEDERVVYPGAGRRWGKHAEATVDIVLRVAAAKTMFDAARNYVNRQIRNHLRRLSAEEGFGWNSEPLFLHTPTDKPGRSVHLDLEELARIEARLEVVLSFLERKKAAEKGEVSYAAIQLGPEDFAESYHLGLFPRYAPKPETTRKLRELTRQVLERPYVYAGHRYELWKAHRQHVQNLKYALLTEENEGYMPLMALGAMSEAQWEVFQKRFGEFGRWLVRSNQGFQAALEGVLSQIETWRSTYG